MFRSFYRFFRAMRYNFIGKRKEASGDQDNSEGYLPDQGRRPGKCGV